ncbi:MAG: hypothetical protein ACLPKI_00005 [Streptosporangiaceae bacterium]
MSRRSARLLLAVAAGGCYAVIVGSFSRFSWPATVAVVSLGTLVVMVGCPEPRRPRPDHGPLPVRGVLAWGAVLAAGGAWELSSLLQQPALDTTSYAHGMLVAWAGPALLRQVASAL